MCHALVIEDQPLLARQMADLLREAGATSTAIASTEQEGYALALERCPSIIVSDVELAQGTGPEACRRIRQELGAVPVVFITATPDRCRDCNYAVAVIMKPATAETILGSLRHIVPVAQFPSC